MTRLRAAGLLPLLLAAACPALGIAACGSGDSGSAPAAPTSPIERIGRGAGVETIGPAECVVANSCALVIVHPEVGTGDAAIDETLTTAVRPTLRELFKERPDTTRVQITVVADARQPTTTSTMRATCEGPSLKTVRWDELSPADLRRRCDVQGL